MQRWFAVLPQSLCTTAPGLVEVEQDSVVEHPGPVVESVSEPENVRRERSRCHDFAAVGEGEVVAALPRGKPGLGEHLWPGPVGGTAVPPAARASTTCHQKTKTRGKIT